MGREIIVFRVIAKLVITLGKRNAVKFRVSQRKGLGPGRALSTTDIQPEWIRRARDFLIARQPSDK